MIKTGISCTSNVLPQASSGKKIKKPAVSTSAHPEGIEIIFNTFSPAASCGARCGQHHPCRCIAEDPACPDVEVWDLWVFGRQIITQACPELQAQFTTTHSLFSVQMLRFMTSASRTARRSSKTRFLPLWNVIPQRLKEVERVSRSPDWRGCSFLQCLLVA